MAACGHDGMAACFPSRCLRNSGREPNGQLLRYPSGDLKPRKDFGTDELGWRKGVVAGTESLEKVEKHGYQEPAKKAKQREDADLTPLGILVARGLIMEHQYDAAVSFLFLHVQVFRDAPKLQQNAIFARAPSGPGKDDAEQAVRRQQRAIRQYGLTQMSPPDSRLICRSHSSRHDHTTISMLQHHRSPDNRARGPQTGISGR